MLDIEALYEICFRTLKSSARSHEWSHSMLAVPRTMELRPVRNHCISFIRFPRLHFSTAGFVPLTSRGSQLRSALIQRSSSVLVAGALPTVPARRAPQELNARSRARSQVHVRQFRQELPGARTSRSSSRARDFELTTAAPARTRRSCTMGISAVGMRAASAHCRKFTENSWRRRRRPGCSACMALPLNIVLCVLWHVHARPRPWCI